MRIFTLLLAILLCLPLTVSAQTEAQLKYSKSFYEKVIGLEHDYIQSLVLPNGAIGYDTPKVSTDLDPESLPTVDGIIPEEYTAWPRTRIVPYFSAFAVLGVIAADRENAQQIALNYINWYISHMNTAESDVNGVAGTVYDYYVFVSPDKEKVVEVTYMDIFGDETRNYDSTDSYASTFIQILCAYTQKYDKDFLNDKKELLTTLKNVIYSTYCESLSLTGAKPDYMVCYLMDNCEVYNGFRDLAALFPEYEEDAKRFENGIQNTLYANGYYYPAVFEDGKPAYDITDKTDFEYYPQATSQLFPITFRIVAPETERADAQYKLFNSLYGVNGKAGADWVNISCGNDYPWALNLRAAVVMEDYTRAEKYVQTVYTKYIATGHPYPYYCAEAGHILLALTEMTENVFSASGEVSSANTSKTDVTAKSMSFKDILPFIALGAAIIIGAGVIIFAIKRKK